MILTPKEEAEKIVNKFIDAIPANQEVDINEFMKVDVLCAIECALIAVDEILQIFNNEWTKLDFWTEEINGTINFWQEVKQELEKLKNETK